MFFVYILYSPSLDRYYIGHTENVEKRLNEHNLGISTYTSKAHDWCLKFTEAFLDRTMARNREHDIKKKKSRKYIEWLIRQIP